MSIAKRIEEARRAFSRGDRAAAAAAHETQRIATSVREEHGGPGSEYVGDLVYGGLDGVITTFAVVSGVAGAELGAGVVLVLGMANLLADGFSMATGAYLSAKSEHQYYDIERQREAWEVDNFPEGERTELREIYQRQGYGPADAQALVEIKTKDRERWVDAMMVEELGMLRDPGHPLANGLVTLVAFVVAGSLPLLPYLLGLAWPLLPALAFRSSLVLSALSLFCLGAAKVRITHQPALRGGLEMLVVGGLAAAVAFGVGALLTGLVGAV